MGRSPGAAGLLLLLAASALCLARGATESTETYAWRQGNNYNGYNTHYWHGGGSRHHSRPEYNAPPRPVLPRRVPPSFHLMRQVNDGLAANCPRAALFIVATLPKIRTHEQFMRVRAAWETAVASLGPAGTNAIATMTEHEDGAIAVWTTILFPGPVASGTVAARATMQKLLGNVVTLFNQRVFGQVHMETVSSPTLADAFGAASQGPIQGAALAGMISVEWVELKPPVLTPANRLAYINAIKAKLPRGAQVQVTTHLDDPYWEGSSKGPCYSRDRRGCNSDSWFYRKGSNRGLLESITTGLRSLLQSGNGTVAAAAASNRTATVASVEHSSHNGHKPYRPVPGRLVTNTLITGVADRQRLAAILLMIQRNPASVFSPWMFGKMRAEPSAGVRLVTTSTFRSPCERPRLTSAQPFGPTTALWEFKAIAQAPSTAPTRTLLVTAPEARFLDLTARTTYSVTVTCITPTNQRVPGLSALTMTTPSAGSPVIAATNPTSSTTATVTLNAPTDGAAVKLYTVTACPKGTTAGNPGCRTTTCPDIICTFDGPNSLRPGAEYVVTATATMEDDSVRPASNSLPLVMPAANAPTLLEAQATGPTSAATLAQPPPRVTYQAYLFTFTPLGGGTPVTIRSPTADLQTASGALPPGTQFEVRVVGVISPTQNSPPSNKLNFVTAASGAPGNTGIATSPTTANIAITPAPGTWQNYNVKVCPVKGPASKCQTFDCTAQQVASNTCSTTGLDPETTYSVQSYAFNPDGTRSPISNDYTFTTPDAPKVVVPEDSVGATTATAVITPPAQGGPYTSYELKVCVKDSNPEECLAPPPTCTPEQIGACPIEGMAPNTCYTVYVTAINGNQRVTSVTPVEVCTGSLPAVEAVDPPTIDSVNVAITPPSKGGPFDSYELKVCVKDSNPEECLAPPPTCAPEDIASCPITGMVPGTCYTIFVTAIKGEQRTTSVVPVEVCTPDIPKPTIDPTVLGPHTTKMLITPPPNNIGQPFEYYEVKVCIKDTQTCFTRQTSGPVRRRLLAAPDTPFDYIVTDPECSDTATDCLRSDTDYTCTTTAVKAGGVIKSLESDPKNFRTDSHDGPSIVASPVSTTSGQAVVTPPALGGPWTTFKQTVCEAANPAVCIANVPDCPANGATLVTCPIPGANPATKYTVVAVATKPDPDTPGTPITSQPSNPSEFTTLIPGPELDVTVVGPHTADLLVTAPAVGGPFTSYDVTICLKNAPSSCFTETCTGTSPCTVRVTDAECLPPATDCLRAEAEYTATAVAKKQDGTTSLPSSPNDDFTMPSHDGPVITSATATSPNAGKAFITPPPTGSWTTYKLTVCEDNNPTVCIANVPDCPVVVPGPADCPIPGANPATTYKVVAVAQKSGSPDSEPSNSATFTTTSNAPSVTAIVGAAAPTTTGEATITAPASPPANGGSWTSYGLTVCEKAAPNVCVTQTDCAAANIAACPLTNLNPATTYTVVATAKSSGSPDSLPSAPAEFTTATPGPSVTAQPVGPHSANFFVNPPLDTNNNPVGGPFQSWELTICLVTAPTTCFTKLCTANANPTATTQCNVVDATCPDGTTTCLNAATSYTVVAVGITAANVRSLDSNEPTFTTPADGPAVAGLATSPTTGFFTITAPPTTGLPWTAYKPTVCEKLQPTNCLSATDAPDCPLVANLAFQQCPLTGLTAGTEYTVSVVATKPDPVNQGQTISSNPSNTADFWTPSRPVIVLNTAITPNPTDDTAAVKVTPPPETSLRPWQSYELKACTTATPPVCLPVKTCLAAADGNADTACLFNGLAALTQYTMTATAKKQVATVQITSQVSLPITFTTAAAPTQLSIVSAQALSPTGGVATATLPDAASQTTFDSYKFEATPQGGGTPVVITSPDLEGRFTDVLTPGTTYDVVVYGVKTSQPDALGLGTMVMTTPPAGAPTIASTQPTSQTTATIVVNPPLGTTPTSYTVELCPKTNPVTSPGSPTCIKVTDWPTNEVPFTGLTPGQASFAGTYDVYATAKVGGNDSPASNTGVVVMPVAQAPTLIYASEKGSTSGCATAVPPLNTDYDSCTFTFAPRDGSAAVTSTVPGYSTCVTTLSPNTNYDVTVSCLKGSTTSPDSNTIPFVTPVAGGPTLDAEPLDTTTANAYVKPPPGGPWTSYTLQICPLNGGPCTTSTCTAAGDPTTCPLTGLTPQVTYAITTTAFDGTNTSPVSNEDLITMPSAPPPVPNSCNTQTDCAPSGRICNFNTDNGLTPNTCICPVGLVDCADKCIDPTQQCCPYNAAIGLNCGTTYPSYSVPSPGTGIIPAQYCNVETDSCACPLLGGYIMCGKTCIDPTQQCCVSDATVGVKCTGSNVCKADGALCEAGPCPAGTAQCPPVGGATSTNGNVCYDDTLDANGQKECCAVESTSEIGNFFNDACYSEPMCPIYFQVPGTSTSGVIVGKQCPSTPNVCSECCDNSDCPAANLGQTCVGGVCQLFGCTTFSCWNAQGRQVCKLDPPNLNGGSQCASCSADIVMRCPGGMCCNSAKCMTPADGACGAGKECCVVRSGCNLANPKMFGRTCTSSCTTPDGNGIYADPYFKPTSPTAPSTYKYSTTCAARRRAASRRLRKFY